MPPPLPRWDRRGASLSGIPLDDGGLPRTFARVGSHISRFGACSAFTHVAACLLAEPPEAALSTEGFGEFVTSLTAPIATGWSEPCRTGIAPAENSRLFTAHKGDGSRIY